MPRFVVALVEFFWSVLAAVLLAGAAVIALLRVLLPEVSTQREAIAAWISETVGRPVVIGEIDARWSGWIPSIAVTDITVQDEAGEAELVSFERATIDIAPLESLASGAVRPMRLTLAGVALTLIRDEHGRFRVAGMPPPKSPIIKWLIEQDNFTVTEADLTIVDQRAEVTFALDDLTVNVRNRGGRKFLNGAVDMPAALGGHLRFRLEADGSPLEAGWNGTIDVRLEDADSVFLARRFDWQGEPPPPARVDLTAWTQWRDARLAQADFDLAARVAADATATRPAVAARGRVSRRSQGWRVDVADLVLPGGEGAAAPAALSAAWHTRNGQLAAVALRARDLPLAPLAIVAGGLAPLDAGTRDQLRQLAPGGLLNNIEATWYERPAAPARYYAELAATRLRLAAGPRSPALAGLGLSARFNRDGGQLRLDNELLRIDDERRLVTPLEVSALDGTVAWQRNGARAFDLRVPRLAAHVNGAELALRGGVRDLFGAHPLADLVLDLARVDGPRLHELLPRKLLPPRGEKWLREVIEAGEVGNGRALVRGALDALPFRHAEGVVRFDFDVRDATLRYSSRWPQARAVDGHVTLDGARATMQVERGRVLGATLASSTIEVPNLYTRQRTVHISGSAHGPAQSATDIVMASPLKDGKAARLQELDIGGDIDVTLDMNLALFPDGPREVLGQARFDGNRIDARKQRIVLEDVVGTVSFTRGDWYGEGLTAVFDGTPVGLVLNGGLDDPNYDSEFRMTGTSPAPMLLRYLERYAPPVHHWIEHNQSLAAFRGELPWKAVLTIPLARADAPPLPQRLTLESSLRGLDIDLPWPFGKGSGERKPLRIEVALANGIAERTRVDFGDTLDAEIAATRGDDGKARVERVEVLLGTLAPEFAGTPGFTVKGYAQQLPLGEWVTFLGRSARAAAAAPAGELPLSFDVQVSHLDLLGRVFDDVRLAGLRDTANWQVDIRSPASSGKAVIPRDSASGTLQLDLDRLTLARRAPGDDPATPGSLDPRRFPALAIEVGAFTYGDVALGRATLTTRRRADGLTLERLECHAEDFELVARGDWLLDDTGQHSQFDIDVQAGELAGLLARFGYNVANIEGGQTDIGIDARWAGTPADFKLAGLNGHFDLHVTDGRFLDIDPGGGRLFGLLSLQTLPRRLSLDFDDLFRKGFAFDSIDGLFMIENGNAYTNSLFMDGPAARIDVSGRTGLDAKDYDQHVVVTPALSNTLPVAGALFGPIGAGAGAVYYLGQKLFKSIPEQIDKFLSREYAVTGSWDNPSIERI
jgi:uncharacterized protein (TIGR02099 family)